MSDPVAGRHPVGMIVAAALLVELSIALIGGAVARDAHGRATALGRVRSSQDAPLAQLRRVKVQLDAVGRETALLAQSGNPRAALIVRELQRRGVTIDPNAPRLTP